MAGQPKALTLVTGAFDQRQLIKILQRTPKEHVYSRPAKGGGQWDYVTGTYVKKVLNMVFGWMWSSEVKRIEEKHGQIVATVRLNVHNADGSILLWKEDIGKKDILNSKTTGQPLDYGNDEKAAVTDGLKRCAAQFGIASDIYGKEEFKEINPEEFKTAPVATDDDEPATDSQKATIKALGGKYAKGITKGEAKQLIIDLNIK